MKINIVVDNPKSWFNPFATRFIKKLKKDGHTVRLLRDFHDIKTCDITFLLSCGRIVTPEYLAKSRHTIVVHASRLPEGRGFAPSTWQVLKGKNEIPLTLFEAVEKFDSGLIYYVDTIKLEGHELLDEIQTLLGKKIVKMCEMFVYCVDLDQVIGVKPEGEGSYYRKRVPEDSKLDISKSLRSQFNLLRVVDNEQYPAFFEYKGHKYILKISKVS